MTPQTKSLFATLYAQLSLVFLFCESFAPVALGQGFEFEGEGKITYRVYDRRGEPYVEQHDNFSVSVKDCKWHIRQIPQLWLKNGSNQILFGETLVSSDLANFYQLTSISNVTGWYAGATNARAFAARIGPGAVPFGLSDPKLMIIWYAFASSCYFNTSSGNYLTPPTVLNDKLYAADFRVLASWELHDHPPNLPQQILFSDLYGFQASSPDPDERTLQFTNCLYTVHEFTRYQKLMLPKRISASFFRRSPTNSLMMLLSADTTIEISQFHELTVVSFRPTISGPSYMSDMRTISKDTPFGVGSPRATDWPSLEKSVQVAKAQAYAISKVEQTNSGSVSRFTITAMVILVIMGFPAVLAIVSRKCKHKT